MTTIHGILECPLLDVGSKSEGRKAILTGTDGKKYKLYRAGILPAGDPFFIPYDGMHVEIRGTEEEGTGNFLVTSILLDDGTEIYPQPMEFPTGKEIKLPISPESKEQLKDKNE